MNDTCLKDISVKHLREGLKKAQKETCEAQREAEIQKQSAQDAYKQCAVWEQIAEDRKTPELSTIATQRDKAYERITELEKTLTFISDRAVVDWDDVAVGEIDKVVPMESQIQYADWVFDIKSKAGEAKEIQRKYDELVGSQEKDEAIRREIYAKLEEERNKALEDAMCSTCGGVPHVSGGVCVCGGTNKAYAEAEGLRNAFYDMKQKYDNLCHCNAVGR